MTTVRPLADKIVVQLTSTDIMDISSNSVYIPGQVKQNPSRGVIIAAGPGKRVKGKIVPLVVKVGDTVLFPKGTGQAIKVDDQSYLVMVEESITGVITAD